MAHLVVESAAGRTQFAFLVENQHRLYAGTPLYALVDEETYALTLYAEFAAANFVAQLEGWSADMPCTASADV